VGGPHDDLDKSPMTMCFYFASIGRISTMGRLLQCDFFIIWTPFKKNKFQIQKRVNFRFKKRVNFIKLQLFVTLYQ
jgi:hypothetical protein